MSTGVIGRISFVINCVSPGGPAAPIPCRKWAASSIRGCGRNILFGKPRGATPLRRRCSLAEAFFVISRPYPLSPLVLPFGLAAHWHSRTLGFDLRPWPGNLQNPLPKDRILAPRTRENLRFPLEVSTTSVPGWRARWSTILGNLRVSR